MPVLALLALMSAQIEFARDIEPIFQARCVSCHGPDRQEQRLRLDRKAIVSRR